MAGAMRVLDLGLMLGSPELSVRAALQALVEEIQVMTMHSHKDFSSEGPSENVHYPNEEGKTRLGDGDRDSQGIYGNVETDGKNLVPHIEDPNLVHESSVVRHQTSVSAMRLSGSEKMIELSFPSLACFKSTCMDTSSPALLCESIQHWPALSTRPWKVYYTFLNP